MYLGGDEAHFGVVADAIARTGRNLRGDFLPLFVNLADPLGEKAQPWGDTWYQPLLFYLTALAVKVLPFSEAAVRAPAAFLGGVVSPLLMYLVAMRLLGNRLQAIVAALVLALAPAHLILSRQALDYICPLPFVLGVAVVSDLVRSDRPCRVRGGRRRAARHRLLQLHRLVGDDADLSGALVVRLLPGGPLAIRRSRRCCHDRLRAASRSS